MQWVGYTPYEDFIRRLSVTNPTRAAIEEMSPQEYRVAAASVSGTNNPSRASSTFVRRIRYMPASQVSLVTLGNSQYVYPMSKPQLARWMTSNSLGQYYNRYIKLK